MKAERRNQGSNPRPLHSIRAVLPSLACHYCQWNVPYLGNMLATKSKHQNRKGKENEKHND